MIFASFIIYWGEMTFRKWKLENTYIFGKWTIREWTIGNWHLENEKKLTRSGIEALSGIWSISK